MKAERGLLFDINAQGYDKWRPQYCEELFSDILQYSGFDSSGLALEIGCGSGQATLPFLETGGELLALEPGKKLALIARTKYLDFPNFGLECGTFENFAFPPSSIDLIFSGTAFHWIPEKTAYPKAHSLLRPAGTLALFWNRPCVNNPEDPVHRAVQKIYEKLWPGAVKTMDDGGAEARRTAEIITVMESYGFVNIKSSSYRGQRTLTAAAYVCLLDTYSDHLAQTEEIRLAIGSGIRDAISENGGSVCVQDYMELYMCQKPA